VTIKNKSAALENVEDNGHISRALAAIRERRTFSQKEYRSL
jgi:hypothetical protein